MSLYGALYSSVSGIRSQGTAIGIISDNISNVNTVGYKAGSQYFSTLVTSAGSTSSYSPGGVRAQNRQLVTQQGLIQTSSSPLDIAISGDGFFVVQDQPTNDGTGSIAYTRAGSFKKDSLGNFVNAQGYYLKAWKLDADGNVVDSNGNVQNDASSLSTLQVVNIGAASGDASATSNVKIGLNLDAAQAVYEGAGARLKPGADGTNDENLGIKGTEIMAPNANMIAGDKIRVTAGTNVIDFEYGGFNEGTDIAGTAVYGTNSSTTAFTGITEGDGFTATVDGQTFTFKYKANDPQAGNGEFNSLATLAAAIEKANGLTARVVNNQAGETRLYISAEDARMAVSFSDITATSGDQTMLADLGISNIALSTVNRFNSLEGLSKIIQTEYEDELGAEMIGSQTTNATIKIFNKDPLTSIQFAGLTSANAAKASVLTEFGTDNSVVAASYSSVATASNNMSSGTIKPHYEQTIRMYDSLGVGHDVRVGFLKTSSNTWRVEVYAANDGDLATNVSRQIAAGEMKFNGDGSLASIDTALINDITIDWASNAEASTVDINWGTSGDVGVGRTDGMRQFAGFYNNYFVTQNGVGAGLLDSVSIDAEGFVVANFNNGDTQKLYKIPLAKFANPDGMLSKNGNIFIQTVASGEVNLKGAGQGGVGSLSPSSLEAANTELSEELTDMIVAQRAYQASSKVITTADELLDDLNRAT